ncbi:MFS transporter [Anaplasma phagocytophilum]|uniref:MFS transporter n=1 Tax=Anaplasma phagocytophilum TaxID=948 RepID=UPI00200CC546|nr:MFS transporter [Anaplasma phagocytophilum]
MLVFVKLALIAEDKVFIKTCKRVFCLNGVVLSTLLCNAIEHYDFMVYGIMSSTLNKVFFVQGELFSGTNSTYLATLIGFLVFAAAFVSRPLGAVFFGYVGDKKGRKVALTLSTGLLVTSVLGMALLPTPKVWGILSILFLALLRVVQGLAFGAEVGGVVLMAETVGGRKVHAIWVARIFSTTVGTILGVFVVRMCELILSPEHMNDWGWRIPFFAAVLVSLPLPYLRRFLHESAEYVEYKASGQRENILKSLCCNISSVLLIISMSALSSGFFYMSVVYMDIVHKSMFLEHEMSMLVLALVACSSLAVLDFAKRKTCFILILLSVALTAYPTVYFIGKGYMVARVLYFSLLGLYIGWYGSFIALIFPVGARQTCFSFAYSCGYLTGALSPALCLWFSHITGKDIMPALYITFLSCVIALIFTFGVRVEGDRYRLTFSKC